jgi:hypothetical protein
VPRTSGRSITRRRRAAATTRIQAVFRGRHARLRQVPAREAELREWRRAVERKEQRQMREQGTAAELIQAAARGRASRLVAQGKRAERLQEKFHRHLDRAFTPQQGQ